MNSVQSHSDRTLSRTVNRFLQTVSLVFLVLSASAFFPIEAIAGLITQESEHFRQERVQSPLSASVSKDHVFIVGLEVEEVEESKEENKEGAEGCFVFCSPSSVAASDHVFSAEDFLNGTPIVRLHKAPLYLLFHNLRIPNT